MTATFAPTDRTSAEAYVRLTLTPEAPAIDMPAALDHLYREMGQNWRVDLLEHDDYWAILWAHRVDADSDDRRAYVRRVMDAAAESTFGFDARDAREMLRDAWEKRQDGRVTCAIPFDDEHVSISMTPAEYDDALAAAVSGDHTHRPHLFQGSRAYSARDLFDVLAIA